MPLFVTLGSGPSTRTWALSLPRAVSVPPLDCAAVLSGTRRVLEVAEPFITVAAEAAGAGAPELLAVVGTVKLAQQVLSAAHVQKAASAEPAPAESTVEDEMPDRTAIGRPLHLVT